MTLKMSQEDNLSQKLVETKNLPHSIETLNQEIISLSVKVDAFLEEQIKDDESIENLHEGMQYALGLDLEDQKARGKRLRPVLGLLTARAYQVSDESILPFAAAIELFHNFALVHDDIEDGDTVRRGRPAVYMKFGLPHGINNCDYIFCK